MQRLPTDCASKDPESNERCIAPSREAHERHVGPNLSWENRDYVDPQHAELVKLRADNAAMARLLLSLEWSGVSFDEDACPDCGALAVRKVHDSDCELAAVLRAAGVLP